MLSYLYFPSTVLQNAGISCLSFWPVVVFRLEKKDYKGPRLNVLSLTYGGLTSVIPGFS